MDFDTTIELAKYVMDFTNRAEDSFFKVDIDGYGTLRDLDYINNPDGWGCFNSTITYSAFNVAIEIIVKYPDYADLSVFSVRLYSKKLGIDTYECTAEDLKIKLKDVAEKLQEFIGSEGAKAFSDLI